MAQAALAFEMEPKSFLLSVAEQAAKNTGSSVADVFRRKKSQSYLLGKLHKRFPNHDIEELRELITLTRWEIIDDPTKQEAFVRPRRPPVKGREPLESTKWDDRLKQLRSIIADDPLTTEELKERAKRELGWSHNFFVSVMAAADGRGILEFRCPYWVPVREHLRSVRPSLAVGLAIARGRAWQRKKSES